MKKLLLALFLLASTAFAETHYVYDSLNMNDIPGKSLLPTGVKCDGASDDTTAIQAAITLAAGGRCVVLPAGTCVTTSPLTYTTSGHTPGLCLKGAGMYETILKPNFAGSTTTLNGALNNSATTITVNSTANFISRGSFDVGSETISYTGKNATQFTGCTRGVVGTVAVAHNSGDSVKQQKFAVVIDGSGTANQFQHGGRISDLSITNASSPAALGGISMNACWQCFIERVRISSLTGDGIRIPFRFDINGTGSYTNEDTWASVLDWFHQNYIQSNGGWGIRLDGGTGAEAQLVENLITQNTGGGVLTGGHFGWVTHNSIAYNGTSGDTNTGGVTVFTQGTTSGTNGTIIEDNELDSNYGWNVWVQNGSVGKLIQNRLLATETVFADGALRPTTQVQIAKTGNTASGWEISQNNIRSDTTSSYAMTAFELNTVGASTSNRVINNQFATNTSALTKYGTNMTGAGVHAFEIVETDTLIKAASTVPVLSARLTGASSTTTIPTVAGVLVFDSVAVDTSSIYNNTTGTVTLPYTGDYRVTVTLSVGGFAAGQRLTVDLLIGGAAVKTYQFGAAGLANETFTVSEIIHQNAGQLLTVDASNNSGVARAIQTGTAFNTFTVEGLR